MSTAVELYEADKIMYMEGTIENAPLAVTKSEQYVKLAKILPMQGRIMRAESRMPSLRKSSPSRGGVGGADRGVESCRDDFLRQHEQLADNVNNIALG